MTTPRTYRIGTRGSLLALTQSGHVKDALEAQGLSAELVEFHTPGDASQAAQTPVSRIGVGVFTQALREALQAQECDIAVHSFKDLPAAHDPRFWTVVPQRVDPRDALISVDNSPLEKLPTGARVGTGAPRRIAQLRMLRPDLTIVPLRGNITTRMGRVGEDLQAVILARAGLERINQLGCVAQTLDPNVLMPAPAQGALSIEVRAEDAQAVAAVNPLNHMLSHVQAVAERAILSTLTAGCSAPVAAYSTVVEHPSGAGHILHVHGGVYALDGSGSLEQSTHATIEMGDIQRAYATGEQVGHMLIDAGAHKLLAS